MDTVRLAHRTVHRLGISLSGLRTTGMWGEPAGRAAAVEAIRRAVELGADVIEVPVPFGPFADLVREAAVPAPAIVVRLTAPVPGPDALTSRLGRAPDVVLAGFNQLAAVRAWGLRFGLIADPTDLGPEGRAGVAAVRGPYPAPDGLLEWCEAGRIPYMAAEPAVLEAGSWTIALPAPRGISEVQDLLGGKAPTPPTAEPG